MIRAVVLRAGDGEHAVSLAIRDGMLGGTLDGRPIPVLRVSRNGAALVLSRAEGPLRVVVARDGARLLVHCAGSVHEFEIADGAGPRRERAGRRHAGDEPFAVSPMTGTLAEIPVKPGDPVAKGGTLAVVEAMKMQFVVRAPRDIVVKAVPAQAGRPVEIGQVLVEFEAAPAEGMP